MALARISVTTPTFRDDVTAISKSRFNELVMISVMPICGKRKQPCKIAFSRLRVLSRRNNNGTNINMSASTEALKRCNSGGLTTQTARLTMTTVESRIKIAVFTKSRFRSTSSVPATNLAMDGSSPRVLTWAEKADNHL